MTDAELIYALADDLLPSEIARKMEISVREVLRIIRRKPRKVSRMTYQDIRRVMGDAPFSVADLADAMEQEATAVRGALGRLKRAGQARIVGEVKVHNGAMAALWMVGESE